jgi:hypothetical protein
VWRRFGTFPNVIVTDLHYDATDDTLVAGTYGRGAWTVAGARSALETDEPPICNAGGPYVAECAGATTSVTLDGTGSVDPNANPLTFMWVGPFAGGVATGATPIVQFSGRGTFPVTLAVSDGTQTTRCSTSVTVVDTTPPVIVAPADVTAECTSFAGASPALGTPTASDVCDASLTITNNALAVFPLGSTTVTWKATDDSNNMGTDTQIVRIVDTTPPELQLSVSPTELWPPNHKLATITAAVAARDVCDPSPVTRLVAITSNEPDDGKGDGGTTNDVQGAVFGTDDRSFEVRAERSGGGTGRVYTSAYSATDLSGNVTTRQATIAVSKSQGHP